MLTHKQRRVLLLINESILESGVSPSYEEIKEALGLKTKSGVHRLIGALEERGFLRRMPNRARALEILKMPESAAQMSHTTRGQFKPSVIEGSLGRKKNISERNRHARTHNKQDHNMHDDSQSIRQMEQIGEGTSAPLIPVMGQIAAGVPIEAIEMHERNIHVPDSMIGKGDYFALDVKGDSMIDLGIFDGDTVVIKRADTAENGTVVVAIVDNEEATLKRLRKKGNSIALESANKNYKTRIFGPGRVRVQGILAGLFRNY